MSIFLSEVLPWMNSLSYSLKVKEVCDELSCWASKISNESGAKNYKEGGDYGAKAKLSTHDLYYLSDNFFVSHREIIT